MDFRSAATSYSVIKNTESMNMTNLTARLKNKLISIVAHDVFIITDVVVGVLLMLYVHGKQLRSCEDGLST